MEVRELRIGNYYAHNSQIRQVSPSTIEEVFDAQRVWCKPIPLSREWLLKFGFCIVDFNGTIKATLPNFRYNIQTVVDYNGFFFCDEENVLTNLLYVHELQNLIFALSKKELTIINQE